MREAHLVVMGSDDEDDGSILRNVPCTSRSNLSKEYVDDNPEEVDHSVESEI